MPPGQRAALVAAAAACAFAACYCVMDLFALPRLVLHPDLGRVAWEVPRPGLPMGYVGLWLASAALGALAGGIVHLVTGRRRAPLPDLIPRVALGWAVTATAIAVAYHAWHSWP